MFSFRRLARRVLKPVVMVTVAGALALSLTVTTTQKAEAVPGLAALPVVLAAEAAAGAAIPLTLPSVLATSLALHPVGWAIAAGAAVVGIGLYATKDYWLPYVTGFFGDVNPLQPAKPGQGATPLSGIKLQTGSSTATGYSTQVWNSTTTPQDVYVFKRIDCKLGNGAVTTRTAMVGSRVDSVTSGVPGKWQINGSCDANETMVGASLGGECAIDGCANGYVGRPGPENTMSWGTLAPADFDPRGADVKYKATVECIDDTGAKSMISADSVGDEGGVKFPSCAAAGKGHGTGVAKVEGYAPTAPGQPGTVPETIWETSAPGVDPNYSQCGPERPGSGCKMAITIDGKPCVVGQWECENWSELANDPATAPRVGCTYGPYTMSLEQCSMMEPAYRPGGAPATEENVDGNPATRNYTEPGGQQYQKPTTGTATVPGTGGAVQPGSDAETVGCFPTGFAAFNPVEWVLQPIRCAFTPKPETHTQFSQRMQNRINSVGFAPISAAWLSAYKDVGGGSGCSGPTVNFSMNGVSQEMQPFQACTEPMVTIAAIANGVATVGIVLFGGLAMVRAIGSAFGLNFSMGGKSDGD